MSKPCYFYVDYTGAQNKKEGRIWPLCIKCGHLKKDAWLWNKDYGPFEIRCHQCNYLIYEPNSQQPTQNK